VDKKYIEIAIWAGAIAVTFAVLWYSGKLVRLRNYILETREELRKCTWPSRDELKGSTVLVFISVILLGLYTVGIDQVLYVLVHRLIRI
jgi:preprotein translocase subunit SecE